MTLPVQIVDSKKTNKTLRPNTYKIGWQGEAIPGSLPEAAYIINPPKGTIGGKVKESKYYLLNVHFSRTPDPKIGNELDRHHPFTVIEDSTESFGSTKIVKNTLQYAHEYPVFRLERQTDGILKCIIKSTTGFERLSLV